MTPSSEEIAAALEDGIRACVVLSKATPEANVWSESAVTLRAHLSRFREEARFRDAAMAYFVANEKWENYNAADSARPDWPAGDAPLTKACAEAYTKAFAAFRALEEPRDG